MTNFNLSNLLARTLACTVTVFAVAFGSAFAQAADSSAHDAHDAHEADANLHVILAEILNASSVLKSEPQSAVGLPRIHGALETYAYYFNHPDWSTEHDH